jgi:hypothetical protein
VTDRLPTSGASGSEGTGEAAVTGATTGAVARSVSQMRGLWLVARVVVTRPNLWVIAILQALRLATPGWWRSWPPLPLPTANLWRLRMLTAYGGDGSGLPEGSDVASYLEWCRHARSWRNR